MVGDPDLIGNELRALRLQDSYRMFAGRSGLEKAAQVESLLAAGHWLRVIVGGDANHFINNPLTVQRNAERSSEWAPRRGGSVSRCLDTFGSFRGAVRQWRKDKHASSSFSINNIRNHNSRRSLD